MKLKIAEEKCKECLLCVEACPKKLLAPSEKINSMGYHPVFLTDEENCTGCSLCAVSCPDCVIQIP